MKRGSCVSAIKQIEVFSMWVGFANAPLHTARLTICNVNTRFVRKQSLDAMSDELPDIVISRLINKLADLPILQLDSNSFGASAAAIHRHYNSCWSNDQPAHLIRIDCYDGHQVTVLCDKPHAYMLPMRITDSTTHLSYETFDPELSRALAALMPQGYLNRDRLDGHSRMLELDREEIQCREFVTAIDGTIDCETTATANIESTPPGESTAVRNLVNEILESVFNPENGTEELHRILEEENRDDSNLLSKFLFKRIPLEAVRELIARGADPSIADDVGQTALMHAAFPPIDRERFQLLVNAGADVEARRDGLTGLHIACAGGEEEAVSEWLRAGADIGARSSCGCTPLMLGAAWPEIVRTLLRAGADVNAVDHEGRSGLIYAILARSSVGADSHLEVAKAMIGAGAAVNLRDCRGLSPLVHAKKVLDEAILEEEVIQAFHPNTNSISDVSLNRRQLAELVVTFLLTAGGIE